VFRRVVWAFFWGFVKWCEVAVAVGGEQWQLVVL